MAKRNHKGQSLVRREKPSHDSWGCATRGSVEKQEGACERHPECGGAAADDGGGETRPMESSPAAEGHDTARKHVHPVPSGGTNGGDPGQCPEGQGNWFDTDTYRSRRAAQPELWNSAELQYGGTGEVTQVGQFSPRTAAGDRRCLLHIPCAACSCTECKGSDHGKCNHRRGIHGGTNTPTGP